MLALAIALEIFNSVSAFCYFLPSLSYVARIYNS